MNLSPITVLHLDWLPAVPEDLVDIDLRVPSLDWAYRSSVSRSLIYHDVSVPVPDRSYTRYQISAELETWVRQNIAQTWKNIGYSCSIPPANGPHFDSSGFWTLQYLLRSGGDDAALVFYEPLDESLELDPVPHKFYFSDYRKLRVIERHVLPERQWYLFNGLEIHSCENIQQDRIALQIRFMRNPLRSGSIRNLNNDDLKILDHARDI